jgi:tripartite-type tricarboxylate transporter receptor subunit TctC
MDMRTDRRRFLTLTASALAAPAIARRAAAAAEWPQEKVIHTIIPFSAGSSVDIIGRIGFDALSQRIGQTIIVENRGGAGGTIGALQAAKAEPDGYTWLFDASNHTVAPAIYGSLTYDPANDFSGVAIFGTIPNVLLVSPDKGIKTVQELVAKAKTQELTFSSAGVGSATHWAAERFRISAGFKATHVPFRGGPEALTEVMTGRIDFCCIGIASSLVFIKEGKLVALCVTSLQRSPSLPDVITSTEAGYKDSHYNFWNGLLLPAKTPRAIVTRLHAEATAALATPELQKKLELQGAQPSPVTPAEFDAQIRQEIADNLRIAKAAGVEAK